MRTQRIIQLNKMIKGPNIYIHIYIERDEYIPKETKMKCKI